MVNYIERDTKIYTKISGVNNTTNKYILLFKLIDKIYNLYNDNLNKNIDIDNINKYILDNLNNILNSYNKLLTIYNLLDNDDSPYNLLNRVPKQYYLNNDELNDKLAKLENEIINIY